jgi:DNA/RNA-binding domain of Phe-tRNA-synthetase-like protein
LYLYVDPSLQAKFPGLKAQVFRVEGVEVKSEYAGLEEFKAKVIARTKEKWELDQLREHLVFRAYRDFFWRVGVDPTKTRPASEALIRRVLRERPLPRINTLVDAYNLASIDTAIPLAAFDVGGLVGELTMREAAEGERFLGIGMEKPVVLEGGEAVVEDEEKLIAIYPYRDADACKVTLETSDTLMLVCGVPNIGDEVLERAGRVTVDYITRFCGGSEA